MGVQQLKPFAQIVKMSTSPVLLMFCLVFAMIISAKVLLAPRALAESWAPEPERETLLMHVVDVYKRVLDRQPSREELDAAVGKIELDPGQTLGLLETSLVLSPERKRQVATQSNALATELEGVYASEQVRIHVRNVYIDMMDAEPPAETETFLVDRFVASGMSQHELMRLIRAVSIVPKP